MAELERPPRGGASKRLYMQQNFIFILKKYNLYVYSTKIQSKTRAALRATAWREKFRRTGAGAGQTSNVLPVTQLSVVLERVSEMLPRVSLRRI
jgi:hypothetical protein